LLSPGAASSAEQAPAPAPKTDEIDPRRYEWSIFPVFSGNTDIGILVGALGVLAKFDEGYSPFRWQGGAMIAASFKEGPEGIELQAHSDFVRFDLPSFLHPRLRLIPELSFSRTISAIYHGVGNASGADPDPPPRKYEYIRMNPAARLLAKITMLHGVYIIAGVSAGYMDIDVYPGSKLEEDAGRLDRSGEPVVRGVADHGVAQLYLGALVDTRDHETAPSYGIVHELSVRASPVPALPFGGATMSTRIYIPLLGDTIVLANRLILDLVFGDAPFYELSSAGAFEPMDFPGGSDGVRGVPAGRYHGRVKIALSAELRAMLPRFTVLGQRLRLGAAAFGDAGRVWASYEANLTLDGLGPGIKYGLGGGARFQWGETVLLRADVAYSPDAAEANPNLPVGIYVELGQSF
jgi:hypothetical protein